MTHPPINRFRKLIAVLLAFSFTGGPQLIAQPAAPTVDHKAVKARIAEAFAALEDAAALILTESAGPATLIEKIGREPAKLLEWVRDNTHLAPYRGSLRGASGVLQDRIGSSLDRSLLLAELLRAAGFEVRLARGAVTDTAKISAAIRPIPADRLAQPADASEELKSANQTAVANNAQASARVQKHVADLQRQLALAHVTKPAPQDAAQAWADVLADHWWVQFRQGDAWTDLDPTLPTARLGDRLAEIKSTVTAPGDDGKLSAIPADQLHTVEIKVVVERLEGEKLLEASPLTFSLKPAELQGRRVVYTHIPVAYRTPGSAPVPEQSKALSAVTEFIPAFIVAGASTVNDAVTDVGQINTSPSLDRTAGMSKAAGSTLGGLGGGLTGANTTKQAAGLWTAEWLEMTVRVPGKPAKTIRREVFDLVGPAARARGNVALPKPDDAARLDRALTLIGQTDILAFGAQPTQEFVAAQYVQNLLKARRRVLATLDARIASGKDDKIRPIDFDPQMLALSPVWGLATGRLAVSPVANDVYLDSPNVFCLTRRALVSSDGKVGRLTRSDLAVNDVAVRAGVDAFDVRVAQGVADTLVESTVVETLEDLGGADLGKSINTINVFDASQGRLVSLSSRAADISSWPADARARTEQSVAGGAVLIASATPAAATKLDRLTGQVAWWKIDPATGTTIGVTGDGYHAATTERQQIENKVNGLLDIPFRLSIDEMKSYSQKEFIQMVVGGKGLNGLQLLRAFQNAIRLHEMILLL